MIPVLASTDSGSPWTFVISVVAALVSIGTVSVALMNYKTANDKLRLDLFEKRFQVYQGVLGLFGSFSVDHRKFMEPLSKFQSETAYARFLFKKEIHDYLKLVSDQYCAYTHAQYMFDLHQKHPVQDLEKYIAQEYEISRWFTEQMQGGKCSRLFEPYLAFYHTSEKLLSVEENWR